MKFGWSRDREQDVREKIDYSHLSNDELLDSFKTENWKKLEIEGQKIGIIQEYENRCAYVQGREAAEIVSLNDNGLYGSYNSLNNQIKIDVTNVSSYEALDSYIHESNHAYQSYCIDHVQGYDAHTFSMMQAEFARDGNGNLYNYSNDNIGYDMQCSELDSNNKAAVFMMAQKERYANDVEYQKYVENRVQHYAKVQENLETKNDVRVAMQNNQSYISYVRGDITEEQYQLLNRNINDENYVDLTVQESKYVNSMLNELNNELGYGEEQEFSNDISYMGDITMMDSSYEANKIENDYMGDVIYSSESTNNEFGTENNNTMDYE